MTIDQTRYDAFWQNPEKYRLTYELNLVPKVLPYGLARGIALHTIVEEHSLGVSRDGIEEILTGKRPMSRGEMIQEPIGDKPRNNAWALFDELNRQFPVTPDMLVQAEAEFKFSIPGSPHSMAGRIDQVLRLNGELWCGEFKTANARKSFDQVCNEWQQKSQASFEILGARSLGFDVVGVRVLTIVEKTPPVIWPLEVKRSEHALNRLMLNVHETCDTIEMFRATYGIETPWPHVPFNWPCSGSGKCEYECICGRQFSEMTEADLEGFKARKEHLAAIGAEKNGTPESKI